jgi:hypothetical protein
MRSERDTERAHSVSMLRISSPIVPLPLLPPWHEKENFTLFGFCYVRIKRTPVATQSKERVCGQSLADETAGLNPPGGIDVSYFVSVVFCQVEVSATGCSLV